MILLLYEVFGMYVEQTTTLDSVSENSYTILLSITHII